MIQPELFKEGMRRLAGGVSLVTTIDGDQPFGLVATSVTSLSADPPSLLVCVGRHSQSHGRFIAAGRFCVNLLRHEDEQLARTFGNPATRDLRFTDSRWTPLATGAPALGTALANFDCRLVQQFDHASHSIFVGEIVDLRLDGKDITPLIYLDGAYMTCAPMLAGPLPAA